jgi:maltoporin
MGKFYYAFLSAAVSLLVAQAAAAEENFEFHGYLRAGTGGNSEGGDQVCFKLPGAGSKYRFGNECEIYSELITGYQAFRGDDGAYFDLKTNLAFVVEGEYENEPTVHSPAFREVYVEAGNVFGGALEGARFWTGKRFYRRRDVHISDFFFWDGSGVGGGIEDIDLGFGKLAYAYLRNSNDDLDASGHKLNDVNDRAVSRHDLRIYGIDVNPGGQLTVGGDLRFSDESRDGFEGEDGFMLTLMHTQSELWGGFNTLALQYGDGSAHTLAANSDDSSKDGRTRRITEQILVEPGSSWSGMGTIVYEDRKDTGDDGSWISIGGRYKYYLSTYLNLVFEAGYDQFDPDAAGENTRKLWKATPAIQLSAGKRFWTRPALRLFATFANWNDAARDAGLDASTEGVFGNNTDGWTFGLQAEAWW